MQKLISSCLSGAMMLMVYVTLSAQVPTEGAILNRSIKTLSGQYVTTVQVDDIQDLSQYISTHPEVQLWHYADGVAKIISDDDQRLSIISYFQKGLLQKTKSKFTSNLQSLLQKSSAKSRHELVISLYDADASVLVEDYLIDTGLAEVVSSFAKTMIITVSSEALEQVALLAEVSVIDILDEPVHKLNYESRIVQSNNVLHANTAVGGYGLTGAGVTIGIGDGGELGNHIDFGQRVINQAEGSYASFGAHGDHVAGIVGSSGALNTRNRGIAPGAQIITQKTTQIVAKAEEYQDAYDMTLTNNSYGVSFNCNTNGTYNYNSVNLDYFSRMNPKMLHIFAAGNNGTRSCDGYPAGYNTILRNYQASKNVITVGAVDDRRQIASLSARGPVADGRIKPEIVATGINITSTGNDYNYFSNSGTSMAAPALTATLALLTEQYQKIYNEKPDGALLKAIACNSADDLGNEGPDYTYGFGMVNARKAVETIIDGRHAQGIIQNGNNNIHQIEVPNGVQEVKVMLYWHDYEGTHLAKRTLVNDLDLLVKDANQVNHLPWVLDTTAANVATPATRGVDNLNNIEQVSITSPTQGTLQVTIDGSKAPYDNQPYFLVYEFISEDVILTYPMGKEVFRPSQYELISWDAEATNASKFKLSLSQNNGASWNTIATDIEADQRSYAWNVPEDMTESAMIRIQKVDGGDMDQSAKFSIREPISTFNIEPICEGMVAIDWDFGNDMSYPVSIVMIDNNQSQELATSNDASYIYDQSLSNGSQYWFALDYADQNALSSSRTIAQSVTPSYDQTCPWSDDLKLTAEPVTFTARAHTSRSTITVQLPIDIKNIGANTKSSIQLDHNISGVQAISIPRTMASGESYTYNLIETLRNLEAGTMTVDISTQHDKTDNNVLEDILTIYTLANDPIQLPYVLDVTSATLARYDGNQTGLEGIDRIDFTQDGDGQLEIGHRDGSKAIILSSMNAEEENQYVLTYNMSAQSGQSIVNLKMDSQTTGSGQVVIEIRGSDQSEWIELPSLASSAEWNTSDEISISGFLTSNGQGFSSSTQIRFTQKGAGTFSMKDLSLSTETTDLPATDIVYESVLNVLEVNGTQRLTWSNNIEQAGYQFEIQYASDSIDLVEGQYDIMAPIQGYGNNPEGWTYNQIIDHLEGATTYYFRVMTIDNNQQVYYSNIIGLTTLDDNIENAIDQFAVQVQSLAFDDINYELEVSKRSRVFVRLVSAAGALVYDSQETYDEGIHALLIPESAVPSSGIYFMEVSTGEDRLSRKIVVR